MSFQAKKPEIFSLRGLSFSCCWWMFVEVHQFQENSPALKNSCIRACIYIYTYILLQFPKKLRKGFLPIFTDYTLNS